MVDAAGRLFKRFVLLCMAIAIAVGTFAMPAQAHALKSGTAEQCRTSIRQTPQLSRDQAVAQTLIVASAAFKAHAPKPEPSSKRMSDSGCCSMNCNSPAVLSADPLPAVRSPSGLILIESPTELVPQERHSLHRPPRDAASIG